MPTTSKKLSCGVPSLLYLSEMVAAILDARLAHVRFLPRTVTRHETRRSELGALWGGSLLTATMRAISLLAAEKARYLAEMSDGSISKLSTVRNIGCPIWTPLHIFFASRLEHQNNVRIIASLIVARCLGGTRVVT